ncbi:hypothetical protein DFJ74DRAFT_754883 [Hyaloraphidium curvatum]|nr:hypothetical protein DFJ74DRAFT_754883 [Hyaloraphidium curvatum]
MAPVQHAPESDLRHAMGPETTPQPGKQVAAPAAQSAAAAPDDWEAFVRYLVSAGFVPMAFGFALQKGRVFEPKVVQDLFLLRDMTMMSMFLSAVSTSQLLFGLLNAVPEESKWQVLRFLGRHFRKVKDSYQTQRGSQRGSTSTAAGAAILGAGMSLAGACPGTVFAAAGSGVPGTGAVLAGGLLGVSLFTAAERTVLPPLFASRKTVENRVEKALQAPPPAEGPAPWYTDFTKLALVSSAALGTAAVALNVYGPNSHRYEDAAITGLLGPLKAQSWNPLAAGMFIGSLQMPMLLFGDTFLGTTSQFLSLIAPAGRLFHRLGLADSKSEISKWMPVASVRTVVGGWGFVAMMAAGAYAAAKLGGTRRLVEGLTSAGVGAPSIVLSKANPLVQPVLAGVLLWFGSRTALGCTSGHGLSGFSLLSVNSVVAVASMFGTGILTAQVLKHFV